MANKFQKSVLERLEQEAARQKQAVPAKEKEPQQEVIKAIPKQKNSDEQETVYKPVVGPMGTTQAAFTQVLQPADIGEYLRRDTLRTAKNKTFYLDTDVIEEVKSTARAQGVTDSKLVNDILRRVLGL